MTDPALFASLPTADFLTQLRKLKPERPELRSAFLEEAALAPGRRSRPVVVFDTNVLLDFWVWDDAAARPARRALENGALWAARTNDTVDEFADVLRRSRFNLSLDQQCRLLRHWHEISFDAALFEPQTRPFCLDPDDVKFLALALGVRADFLITKDKKVLKAGRRLRRLHTRTLTPNDFSRLLSSPDFFQSVEKILKRF